MNRQAYTPREIAERWQCSDRHVRNMINEGRLRSFKLGGKLVRIPLSAVEEYEQCPQNSGSSSIEENSPSNGTKEPAASANPSEPPFVLILDPQLPNFAGDTKPGKGRSQSPSNMPGQDTGKASGSAPQP